MNILNEIENKNWIAKYNRKYVKVVYGEGGGVNMNFWDMRQN